MMQSKTAQSNRFDIPFDRQELADYLDVDRSGLSVEISKLKKEGIIENSKNHFVLL
jgi:CRP-like cAMP-binding protein